MNADTIFAELSLVIAIAAVMALLMRLIHQPLIIGHILTGIIVGPTMLHLIKTPDTITTFSNIGIALLLFIIGLGLNPRVIKEVGKVAAVVAVIQVGLTIALGWATSLLLGRSAHEAILIGIALSFSSTIIILKLLSDKKEQSRLYGKITIGLLIVQDLLAMVALLIVTAQHGQNGISLNQLEHLLVKGLGIAVVMFFVGLVVLPKLQHLIAGSQESLFLFAIGWGFGAAALFDKAGFSLEIGALLAGVSLASLPYTQEMSARLRPLRDFFLVVFFIALGTQISFHSLQPLLPIIIFGSLIVVFFKPLVVLISMGLLGYTKRTSFKTAITTGQISEFSLVLIILANHQGLVSEGLVSALTIIALFSIAVSTYLTLYNDPLYRYLEPYLSLFERHHTQFEHESQHHYDIALFGYSKGAHEFLKVFASLKKPFIVVDYDPTAIELLEHQKVHCLYGDITDLELLEEIGLDKTRLVISTISDFKVNSFLIELLAKINPHCVVIIHADNIEEATKLYELGASYVMLPHYIGSEKIGAFIKRHGFSKRDYKQYRQKHLAYLQQLYSFETDT
jgi:Kef-type K+ transport system membrane component KefB